MFNNIYINKYISGKKNISFIIHTKRIILYYTPVINNMYLNSVSYVVYFSSLNYKQYYHNYDDVL